MSSAPGDYRPAPARGGAFWMVFVANLTCDFLSALDLTAISTALPTIIEHLHGVDFIWAGSAYALASSAIVPFCGNLASIFGRKPVLLVFIAFFAVGSALCGAASNLNMLIAGRVLQGLGGGGCICLTEIIYADLVPLPERGTFLGITASVWAFACAVGPPIAGALSGSNAWRWLFFLNIPVCAIAAVLTVIFLRVKPPTTSFREKMKEMDWFGCATLVVSTALIMLALTWGGLRFAWDSAPVLAPLCLGVAGLVSFFLIEFYVPTEPTLPWQVINNRTSISGYLATFIHGMVSMAAIYFLPVYFQAVDLASPIASGIDMFGLAFTVAPFAMICGASVQIFNRYRPQNYLGWMIIIIGFGLLSMLDIDSSRGQYIGFQVLLGVGLGMIWIATQFPILAPLPFSNNARALAFFTFTRCFAQSWGIAIGGTILQTSLIKSLPPSFYANFPKGVQIAYAVIPQIPMLEEPLKDQVRAAFATSLQKLWKVLLGVSFAGLLSVGLMAELPMLKSLDEQWALQIVIRLLKKITAHVGLPREIRMLESYFPSAFITLR